MAVGVPVSVLYSTCGADSSRRSAARQGSSRAATGSSPIDRRRAAGGFQARYKGTQSSKDEFGLASDEGRALEGRQGGSRRLRATPGAGPRPRQKTRSPARARQGGGGAQQEPRPRALGVPEGRRQDRQGKEQ